MWDLYLFILEQTISKQLATKPNKQSTLMLSLHSRVFTQDPIITIVYIYIWSKFPAPC